MTDSLVLSERPDAQSERKDKKNSIWSALALVAIVPSIAIAFAITRSKVTIGEISGWLGISYAVLSMASTVLLLSWPAGMVIIGLLRRPRLMAVGSIALLNPSLYAILGPAFPLMGSLLMLASGIKLKGLGRWLWAIPIAVTLSIAGGMFRPVGLGPWTLGIFAWLVVGILVTHLLIGWSPRNLLTLLLGILPIPFVWRVALVELECRQTIDTSSQLWPMCVSGRSPLAFNLIVLVGICVLLLSLWRLPRSA